MQIEKRLIPFAQRSLKENRFIIAHESGNPRNTGSNALENEISFMTRNALNGGPFVSHWVGGGGKIVQIARAGKLQFGAGPKANPYAYAQVELCRTGNVLQFDKDYAAYIWLLRQLAKEAGIPLLLNKGNGIETQGIKTHHWITRNLGGTTHTDPDHYLHSFGISINQFRRDIEKENALLLSPALDSPYVYTVKAGDTLWQLAHANNLSVEKLKAENHLSTDLLKIGQRLQIPFAGHQNLTYKEWVKQIQRKTGAKEDGIFGPLTAQAVLRHLQKELHLSLTGCFDSTTEKAMPILKEGMVHPIIFSLQAFLVQQGFLEAGPADGQFGPRTKKAVKQFQVYQGLVPDGIAGPLTVKALFK